MLKAMLNKIWPKETQEEMEEHHRLWLDKQAINDFCRGRTEETKRDIQDPNGSMSDRNSPGGLW